MTLERGLKAKQEKHSPELDTGTLLNTEWDTEDQERAFLSAGIDYFGPIGKNFKNLMRLLTCGVDETWFIHPNRRFLYQGLFNAALMADRENTTVRAVAIAEEAEKASGEKGWAIKEMQEIIYNVPVFNLDDFLKDEIPLWWRKLKKPKLLDCLSRMNMLLAHLPPTLERLEEIDRLAVNAVNTWRAEAVLLDEDNCWLDDLRDRCLEPIPANYRISTGLSVVDEFLNGGISGPSAPDKGRLIVICARPGIGKTLVAANIAVRVAARGWTVAFWSFEMSRDQVGLRMLANIDYFNCRKNGGTPITYKNLNDRYYPDPDQKTRLRSSKYNAIQENTKILGGNAQMQGEHLCNHMRAFARKYPSTRLFVVDHLGLLDTPGSNKAIAVGEATRMIKTTATELGIDVLVLSQLNRESAKRDDKKPTLTDLRDSGCIEQDADIVIGVHREFYYKPENLSLENDCEIICLKNRQGDGGGKFDHCAVYLDNCSLANLGSSEGIEPAPEEEEGL